MGGEKRAAMSLASLSGNGEITVPIGIRRQLGLKSGDKILFCQKQNGEIVVSSASSAAIRKARDAFSGAAERMGASSEGDIQKSVNEARYMKGKSIMKKILGIIFMVFGLLEVIVLSAVSTFDKVEYTSTNHFVGFMSAYGLWIFLVGAMVVTCLGIFLLMLEKN